MAYIANKPVRFDRDYKIGEVIPEDVIAPGMTRKLMEMGRILRVDLPRSGVPEENRRPPQNGPQEGAENGPDSDSVIGNTDTQPDDESPQEGAENDPDSDSVIGNTDTQPDDESPQEGAENGPDGGDTGAPASGEFICEVCGRAFSSQQALAAHSRSHKE